VDASDHGKVVLSAILRGRKDFLQLALRHLQPDQFTDQLQRGIFAMCEQYLDIAGEVMPRHAMSDMLRASNQPPGTSLNYEQYFDYLITIEPQEADFRWSMQQLREIAAERMTGQALAAAMDVLRKGRDEGKKHYQGHKDARSWVMSQMAAIDRDLHQADAPEGDMRLEGKEIVAEYTARRAAAQSGEAFVQTSVPELDEVLGGGLNRGELALVAGFTTAGKTSMCVQIAWHAVTQQGKNVIIFTSETLRSQIRVKIVARHSRLPQFSLDQGLNSKLIKAGLLNNQEQQALAHILQDWTSNTSYGRCHIAQVPRGATPSIVEARMRRLATMWSADLVVFDYLQLLRPDTRFATEREALGRILKDSKEMSATYQDGAGIPFISPWQMSRAARDAARGGAGYNLSGLSETNEASATPDVIVSLLEPDDYKGGRKCELRLQVLKGRDGERGSDIMLDADYATSFFEARTGNSHQGLLGLESDLS
jgi:replicative DNA helicase